jgi:peptidoglycan-associated lipoprotein
MKQLINSVLIVAASAVFLAGCESTMGSKEGGDAAVEERSTSGDSATTTGLSGDRGFQGHMLDDPSSPLSKRVVYFEFDSSEISASDRYIIEAHAGYLGSNPSADVTLEGHADERGSREYNVALGERRASAVRRLLGLLGASDSQVNTVSYGEERPVDPGHNESAWAKNRRVEIIYNSR